MYIIFEKRCDMSHKGQNIENVKINNRASTIRLLLSKGAMSRSDIAAELHLTPATVTTICNEFFQRNLLVQREERSAPGKVGRKKCPVEFNYDYKRILAIHIHTAQTNLSICNVKGKLLDETVLSTDSGITPECFLAQVASCCAKLLWNNQLSGEDILGVGVTIIGPVNHLEGISLNAFSIWDHPVNIREILEKELRLPVCVESNVCSIVEAELLYNDIVAKNILAVNWGPGVGSASIIDGKVFKGRGFQSAELGHNFVDHSGQKCRCGKVGCLETKLSVDAIIEKLLELARSHSPNPISKKIESAGAPTRENISDFLALSYAPLDEFLSDITYQLAVVVNNAVQILAPDKIILFGELFSSQSLLIKFKNHIFSINDSISEDMFMNSLMEDRRNYIGATSNVVKRFLVDTGGF